jgi:hypothetical protein
VVHAGKCANDYRLKNIIAYQEIGVNNPAPVRGFAGPTGVQNIFSEAGTDYNYGTIPRKKARIDVALFL